MCAETEEEMKGWMEAISNVIFSIHGLVQPPSLSLSNTPVKISKGSGGSSFALRGTSSRGLIMTKEDSTAIKHKVCTLFINVAEARNLPGREGTSDPYVICDAGNAQVRTRPIFKTLAPFWGEDFTLDLVEGQVQQIKFTLWDEDKFTKDTLLGQVIVPISSLSGGKTHEQWYPLFPVSTKVYVSGDVHLRLEYNTTNKTVSVRVIEGRNLASKDANGLSDPYIKVKFGGVKKKTRVQKKTLNPFYNEDFLFDVVDNPNPEKDGYDNRVVRVEIWDWDRVGANDFMGEVLISIDEIEPNMPNDMWFILLPKQDNLEEDDGNDEASSSKDPKEKKRKTRGEVRLKMRYTEDVVLPVSTYEPLLQFLIGQSASPSVPTARSFLAGVSTPSSVNVVTTSKEEPKKVLGPTFVTLLDKVTAAAEREPLARALVATYDSPPYKAALTLLVTLTQSEIKNTIHEETIFRGNSLATKGVDAYMKLIALPYLEQVIGPTIKKVYAYKKSCEVDPTRDKEENIPKNNKRLLKLVKEVTSAIFGSVLAVPVSLRALFAALQEQVIAQYGQASIARYSVVSSFIFLRHICPALLGPKLFNLAPDHPDQRTARILTLLSKIVQNLANLAEFGQKEPYMKGINPFIVENMQNMKDFLDGISSKPHPSWVELSRASSSGTPTLSEEDLRQVAAVHRHMARSSGDLEVLLRDKSLDENSRNVLEEGLKILSEMPPPI
eukprot:TRINITY_DN7054_c0_g1_i1.p1 TRINITY_DN7054_c0_g1~~TRINITY_DN7054_c0_g1_i1.p1  ORF type:complete len:846 (+),score=186.10 TRINITY_DN7054_c0_g1_i1:374-2539(+)